MRHQFTSSNDKKCTCDVKRRSFFNLIHLQSGVHKMGCPRSTKLDDMMRSIS